MRLNLASDSVTPSACGIAPPDRPVPAPRATTGTPSAWQVLSTAATCASVSGSATTSGRCAVGGEAVALVGRGVLGVPDQRVRRQHRPAARAPPWPAAGLAGLAFGGIGRRRASWRTTLLKTIVRCPFSSTRCSLCHFTARASTWLSVSRPQRRQVFDRVGVVGPFHVLLDDRTFVEVGGHVVGGGADQLHAAVVRLVVGLGALEAGQEGVVDVDRAAGQLRAQVVRGSACSAPAPPARRLRPR